MNYVSVQAQRRERESTAYMAGKQNFMFKLSFDRGITELDGSSHCWWRAPTREWPHCHWHWRRGSHWWTTWAGLGILKQADGTAEGLKEPFSRSLPCWGMHGGDYPGRLIWLWKALWVKLRCLDKSNDNRSGQETLFERSVVEGTGKVTNWMWET